MLACFAFVLASGRTLSFVFIAFTSPIFSTYSLSCVSFHSLFKYDSPFS